MQNSEKEVLFGDRKFSNKKEILEQRDERRQTEGTLHYKEGSICLF